MLLLDRNWPSLYTTAEPTKYEVVLESSRTGIVTVSVQDERGGKGHTPAHCVVNKHCYYASAF
jgi:hypothetical protein